MKKTHDKGTLWFYIVLVVSVLMVNPPILPVINVAAIRLKAWDCSKYDPDIKPGKRPDLER